MKKFMYRLISLMAVASFVAVMTTSIAAAVTPSKDENKLKAEITMLNADAKLPQAEKVIKKQLTDNFNVTSQKLNSLISKRMGYGEIAAVLAFADKMPGGVTDANINQVLNMRQSKAGWDQIAKSANVDLSEVAGSLGSFEDDIHSGIKQALAEAPTAGAGGAEESGGIVSEPGQEMPDEGLSGGATGGTGTEGMPGGATGGTGTEGMPGGTEPADEMPPSDSGGTGGGMSGGSTGGYGSGY